MSILMYLVIGLIVGVFSGFMGVGGGIILVPILVLFVGMPMHTATGTSLMALLLPVGALGVYEYWRVGKINADNFKIGLLIAVGIFFGAYFGSKLAVITPEKFIRIAFALTMFGGGIKFLLAK